MSLNKVIQVFEYGSLFIDEKVFTENHFTSIVKMTEKLKEPIVKVGHKRIVFQNYVGVLQVGDLTIEVLPKADRVLNSNVSKWRNALFEMLRVTGKLSVSSPTAAKLKTKQGSLFDFYLEQFLNDCEKLISQGLQRKYVRKIDNLMFYKGHVLFGKQFSVNAANQSRIITEHDSYELDHTIHRILRYAIELIPGLTCNHFIIGKSKAINEILPILDSPSTKDLAFWRRNLDRNTERYKKALEFAELIISTYCPVPNIGRLETIAFLFDMNKLFEEYVLKCLKIAGREKAIDVAGQAEKKFWDSKSIRPDIVVKANGVNYVLDTKWKILDQSTPSDSDLKQMYVYNNYFDSQSSVLLYPNVYDLDFKIGQYHKKLCLNGTDSLHSCSLMFLDLFDNKEQLKEPRAIGKQIFDKLSELSRNINFV